MSNAKTDQNTAVVILLVGAVIYILVFVYWIKQTTTAGISARPTRFKRRHPKPLSTSIYPPPFWGAPYPKRRDFSNGSQ